MKLAILREVEHVNCGIPYSIEGEALRDREHVSKFAEGITRRVWGCEGISGLRPCAQDTSTSKDSATFTTATSRRKNDGGDDSEQGSRVVVVVTKGHSGERKAYGRITRSPGLAKGARVSENILRRGERYAQRDHSS